MFYDLKPYESVFINENKNTKNKEIGYYKIIKTNI